MYQSIVQDFWLIVPIVISRCWHNLQPNYFSRLLYFYLQQINMESTDNPSISSQSWILLRESSLVHTDNNMLEMIRVVVDDNLNHTSYYF